MRQVRPMFWAALLGTIFFVAGPSLDATQDAECQEEDNYNGGSDEGSQQYQGQWQGQVQRQSQPAGEGADGTSEGSPWEDSESFPEGGSDGAGDLSRLIEEEQAMAYEARISALERELEKEKDARRSAEESVEQVQQTLDGAIDYRRARRADAREYLKQMKAKDDGAK